MENLHTSANHLSATKRALLEKLRRGQHRPAQPAQAIPRRETSGRLPLSFAQQRLWMVQQWAPASTAYNISGALCLEGELDIAALEKSVNEVVGRHEVLRTTFSVIDQEPVQVIAPAEHVPLKVTELSEASLELRRQKARELAVEDARRPFDLAGGPLLRLSLLRVDAREHLLLLSVHHTVFDGWSQGLFIEELSAAYDAFSQGATPRLPELPIQYADYALWQRKQCQAHDAQLGYWKRELADAAPVLNLPTDHPRPQSQTFGGDRRSRTLTEGLSAGLRSLAQKEGVTMFMLLLAAFKALLFRYTGQQDIVIGTPVAGRGRAETERLIGVFINMLALRDRLTAEQRFAELLNSVRETTLEAYANQDVPFERIVEALNPARDLSRTPIFQVAFAVQNAATGTLKLRGLECRPLQIESGRARFDLTLFINEKPSGLSATLAYNHDLFKAETIARMLQHFIALLESITASPDARIGELNILSESETLLLSKSTAVDLPEASFAF